MERAYDFHKLVGCANTLNRLARIEYRDNGLKINRHYNKQKNIWASLHSLVDGEIPANLGDYLGVMADRDLVVALKEGLKEAQGVLRVVNMAPSSVASDKTWFQNPWMVEVADVKHWAYTPPKTPTPGEDGDG